MKKDKKNSWKQISSQIVHKNPWYQVRKDGFILPSGKEGKYYIMDTYGAVFIIPVKDGKIIFVKQYRYPLKKWTLELPNGGIKENTTSLLTVKEELREEVGYKSQSIKRIGKFSSISGVSSEICFVYLATDLMFVGQELEESELEAGLKVVEIGIKKVYRIVDKGKFLDGQTIAALALARNRLLTTLDKNL